MASDDDKIVHFPRTVRNAPGRFVIPERIREARRAIRWTQQELAEAIGVTRQAVSAYEAGKKSPDPDVFNNLMAVLKQPARFFTSEKRPIFGEIGPQFFRKRGPDTERRYEACSVLGDWFVQLAKQIDQYVNFPAVSIPDAAPKNASESVYTGDEIEAAAKECRKHWQLGPGPISNVLNLLEAKGILVCRYELENERVDAFSFWSGERPFIFMAAERDSVSRARFDLAHELGHLVLHRWVERGELLDPKRLKIIEAEADRFAGAFLLPNDSFPNEVLTTRLDAFVAMKKRWKVSVQAMVYRCRDLELIDEQQFTNLYKSISFRKWRTKEPLDTPADLALENPRLLSRAVELIIQGGKKHPAELANEFAIATDLAEMLCNLRSGTLSPEPRGSATEPTLR
jgi:Zn-dependent peptidase ImmA (M78 family)/transcriptional regulator with XRE-family HTH domain